MYFFQESLDIFRKMSRWNDKDQNFKFVITPIVMIFSQKLEMTWYAQVFDCSKISHRLNRAMFLFLFR